MNITKPDFKILYNTISNLSYENITSMMNNIKLKKSNNNNLDDLVKRYDSNHIVDIINKINTKILFGGKNEANNVNNLSATSSQYAGSDNNTNNLSVTSSQIAGSDENINNIANSTTSEDHLIESTTIGLNNLEGGSVEILNALTPEYKTKHNINNIHDLYENIKNIVTPQLGGALNNLVLYSTKDNNIIKNFNPNLTETITESSDKLLNKMLALNKL
jgi:hypothetical protein